MGQVYHAQAAKKDEKMLIYMLAGEFAVN